MIKLAAVLLTTLLLAGCHGWATPNEAVFPNGGAGHTPPPAVNLPPQDVPPGSSATVR